MRRILMTTALSAAVLAGPGYAADSVKIGLVTTLTTPSGAIGRDVVDAANLAIEHVGGTIAGKKIEMLVEDDGAKPELGRQKAEKLLRQDKVDVMAGFNWSNVLLAARKTVLDSGKLLISVNAGPSDLAGRLCHENFFSTRGQNDVLPGATGEMLNKAGFKKVYLMAPNYAGGKDVLSGVERTYKGQVIGREFTKWGDDPQLDFSAELAKVKASDAEALVVFYPGRAGPAFGRQFEESGAGAKVKLFTIWTLDQLSLPRLQEAGIKGVLGTEAVEYWSPDLDTPANKRFVADFKKKYGRIPSMYAAQAYDLVPYLKAAIEQAGGDVGDTAKVRAALREAKYDSLRGPYKVGANGFPIDRFYRQEIYDDNGTWTLRSKEVVMENTADPHIKDCNVKS
jgi:branched-chain amino acid transport system substrate-binding protein